MTEPGLAQRLDGVQVISLSAGEPDVPTPLHGRRIDTDPGFVIALLEEQHVALIQGSACGRNPYVRVSDATRDAPLREAGTRIQQLCRGLSAAGDGATP